MNKIERVRSALAGTPMDHPPFTIWYHFGNQHAPADRRAWTMWASPMSRPG